MEALGCNFLLWYLADACMLGNGFGNGDGYGFGNGYGYGNGFGYGYGYDEKPIHF